MKSMAWLCCLLLVGCGSPKETPISTTSSTQTTDPTCQEMADFLKLQKDDYYLEFDVDKTGSGADENATWGVVCHDKYSLTKIPSNGSFTIALENKSVPAVYVRLPASLQTIKWKGQHDNEKIEDSIDLADDTNKPSSNQYAGCFQGLKAGHVRVFNDGNQSTPATHSYLKFDLCPNLDPHKDKNYAFVIHLDKEGQPAPYDLDPQIINHGTGLHGK